MLAELNSLHYASQLGWNNRLHQASNRKPAQPRQQSGWFAADRKSTGTHYSLVRSRFVVNDEHGPWSHLGELWKKAANIFGTNGLSRTEAIAVYLSFTAITAQGGRSSSIINNP